MLAKYTVEYGVPFHKGVHAHSYQTDDPITCEQFLAELLEAKFKIREIRHEGVALSKTDFNRMVKTAANIMVAGHLCASLDLNQEEERFRFGFAA